MANRYDQRAQLKVIAEDVLRHRDTVEKINHPVDPKLREAAALMQAAASLIRESTGARTETFTR